MQNSTTFFQSSLFFPPFLLLNPQSNPIVCSPSGFERQRNPPRKGEVVGFNEFDIVLNDFNSVWCCGMRPTQSNLEARRSFEALSHAKVICFTPKFGVLF
ncbi:hypothetical protein AVEN_956-1 [Araneus ventricosus]|uniref:Uncharacterized protein n=1 Tax=Araneus ventricosus TaxID=182803 RepID=A0A4Y2CW91_ARAVE|nr:hypothetical protein AVEN_956-1 [Araneus ventricosus]